MPTGVHSNDLSPVYNPVRATAAVTTPHWHVLGAGAIGSLFAAGLQGAGCDVTLLTREAPLPARRVALVSGGRTREFRFPVCKATAGDPVSHLLVTTKAYDAATAVASIAHRLAPAADVLVLANGMGLAEELRAACPGVAPYFGTTTEGAYRSGPGQVTHAGSGITLIGRSGQAGPPGWFAHWRRVTTDCRWEPDIEAALWRKLAVNCAINPLTAVAGCRNGELLNRESLRRRLDILCREIEQVSEAAGYTAAAQDLNDSVERVIRATATNFSSMLQDLRAGRRTEIDYITGYLLRIADRQGVDAPANRAMMEEVENLGQPA
jgi:2-dehydropantoate 2-reductase